ncbi:MAG TPA: hypothetical protein VG711_02720 [Phycisphaerales bacterium]|nr:hypothetical protein [Phycisphaerales bacterium]
MMNEETVQRAFRVVVRQPNWLIRWTIYIFAGIIALPFILLLFAAAVIAAAAFAIFLLVNAVVRRVRAIGPRNDGRENVRVMRR